MKKKYLNSMLAVFFGILSFISCQKKDAVEALLTVSKNQISVTETGGDSIFTITSNDKWTISNSAQSWLQLSQTSGNSGTTAIHLIVATPNTTGAIRSTILVVNSSNGQARRIIVSQPSMIYPSYNTSPKEPDATGMGIKGVLRIIEKDRKVFLNVNC